MLAAHNQVSVMEMDKQVADTAKKLEAGVDQLRQRLIDSDAEFHQGKLTFTTVKELLTDIVGLKAKVAQLPQTETSTHFAIGQGVWQAILQETEWLTDLTLTLTVSLTDRHDIWLHMNFEL